MRPSYLYNGNSYTSKMAYLYWNVSCCFGTKWWDVFWLEFDYCWKSCWRYGFFSLGLICMLESMLTDLGFVWCVHFFSVRLLHCHIVCEVTLKNMRILANRPVCDTVVILVVFIYRDYFECAPNQWQMAIHFNILSHWLGAYTKWALCLVTIYSTSRDFNPSSSGPVHVLWFLTFEFFLIC